jgi:excisionase family DNA binding protein
MGLKMSDRYGRDDILLSTKEAAEYLGISYQTLAGWRFYKRENLKWVRVGSRKINYYMSDIMEFLDSKKLLEKKYKTKRGK